MTTLKKCWQLLVLLLLAPCLIPILLVGLMVLWIKDSPQSCWNWARYLRHFLLHGKQYG